MRTEHNYTPNQLWVLGMLQARDEDPENPIVQDVVENDCEVSLHSTFNYVATPCCAPDACDV